MGEDLNVCNYLKSLLAKLFSGRYFVVVAIISTYCVAILKTISMVCEDKLSLEVFLGLFSGFSSLAGTIVYAYFNRTDRDNNHNNPDK